MALKDTKMSKHGTAGRKKM